MSSSIGDRDLDPQEVARGMREEGWQVVDVREPYEREAGRIPGTRHIELARLTEEAPTLDRDRPVVFQCRVGSRSAMAADAFRASGWEAYNLAGGIQAWVEAGLEIEPADGRVAAH